MKYLIALLTLLATPALAHHEVVVATSMIPLMAQLAGIAIGIASVVLNRLRKK